MNFSRKIKFKNNISDVKLMKLLINNISRIKSIIKADQILHTAIFFTSNACKVAEQTIICKRFPSDVILGICLCNRSMSASYPLFNKPSASSNTKNRQCVRDKCPEVIRSSKRPGVPTTMSIYNI